MTRKPNDPVLGSECPTYPKKLRTPNVLFGLGFASTAALIGGHHLNAVAVERGGALREVQEVAKRPVMVDPVVEIDVGGEKSVWADEEVRE